MAALASGAVVLSAAITAAPAATAQQLEWARSAGGASFDYAEAVATDLRGHSYVTGSFFGRATFGAGEANATVLESTASPGMFVAKYARNGPLLWARSAAGTGDSLTGLGIATDPGGNS